MLFNALHPALELTKRTKKCARPLAVLCLLTLSLLLLSPIKAAAARERAGCPTVDPSTKGWLRNSMVYYDVDGLPEKIRTQVLRAIATWNTANRKNSSGVIFKEKQQGGTVDYIFSVGGAEGYPSITYITRDETMLVVKAETIIAARDNGFFSPQREGYERVFEKITLHEIGHTMGLDDVAVTSSASLCGGQIPRTSVMNSFCGVNDSGNNVPTQLSACDQSAVKENFDSQTQLSPSLKSKTEGGRMKDELLWFAIECRGCGHKNGSRQDAKKRKTESSALVFSSLRLSVNPQPSSFMLFQVPRIFQSTSSDRSRES